MSATETVASSAAFACFLFAFVICTVTIDFLSCIWAKSGFGFSSPPVFGASCVEGGGRVASRRVVSE
jgi:hypothetical protein